MRRPGDGRVYACKEFKSFMKPFFVKETACYETLNALNKPNFIRTVDSINVEDGSKFLFMEIIDSIPLIRRIGPIKLGKFGEKVVQTLVPKRTFLNDILSMAKVVQILNREAKIINCNLRPESWLFSAEGVATLCGFSKAKFPE